MISLFRLVLAAALALLAVGAIHADTVFVASDGLLVHMPRSTLQILDSPQVKIKDDDGLPKKVKIEQLNIAGTLKGNVIGWHPDYGPNLFIVSVVDSKSGRISTLPQNIIHCQIKPHRTGKGFMGYFNNKTPANYTSYPDFLFQLRVLELPLKEDVIHPNRSRFLVSTAYAGQWLFYLDEETDPGTGIKTLSATEVGRVKTDVPGGYDYRVINIDLIDPRQYQSNEIRADDPYAIAMWFDGSFDGGGSGEYWSHENNVFKYLANGLLIATVDDSGDVPLLKIRRVSDEAGAFSRMTRYWNKSPTAITGGALINPDKDGYISYWFTKSTFDRGRRADFVKETWSGRLTYDKEKKTFGMNNFVRQNDYRWSCETNDKPGLGRYGNLFWGTTDFIPNMFAWNHNPRIRGNWGDDIKEVLIDSIAESKNACLDKDDEKQARWEFESRPIGTIIEADDKAVSTAKAAIIPDETLRLTDEEKALVASGAKVDMVFYGWPYFAGDPANFKFTRESAKQVVEWEKWSHGAGFESKLGFGTKNDLYEVSATFLAGFASKNEEENQKTQVTTHTLTEYKAKNASIDHFGVEGFLLYSEVLPKMKSLGLFTPNNAGVWSGRPVIIFEGLNDEFQFPVAEFTMTVPFPLLMQRFNVKNPGEEWRGDSVPGAELQLSPLSKGLIARPISSAIKCDVSGCKSVKADIAKWEEEAKLQDLITLSELTKRGEYTGVKNEPFAYQFNADELYKFSEQVMKTKVTDSSWYAGFNFSVKPKITGVIMDVTGKYNGALVKKDTVSKTESYAIQFPRSEEAGKASRLRGITHVFSIKMDRLKFYIKENTNKKKTQYFGGGKPPLIPDWNWNFDQDLLLVVTQLEP